MLQKKGSSLFWSKQRERERERPSLIKTERDSGYDFSESGGSVVSKAMLLLRGNISISFS